MQIQIRERRLYVGLIFAIADVAVLAGCFAISLWLFPPDAEAYSKYYAVLYASLAVLILVDFFTGAFVLDHRYAGGYRLVMMQVLLIIGSMVLIGFLTKISAVYSRLWFGTFGALLAGGLLGLHVLFRAVINHPRLSNSLVTKLLVVGAAAERQALVAELVAYPAGGIKVAAEMDLEPNGALSDANWATLRELVVSGRVHEIVLATPWEVTSVRELITQLRDFSCIVNLAAPPDLIEIAPGARFQITGGVPMLNVVARPMEGWQLVAKIIEDRTLSFVLLILLSPLFAILAVAVKLDSRGPVFFKQKRHGFNNNHFTIYKYRTMYAGACSQATVPQAIRNDPRVTRIGGFLRRTSLDELPQLFNVLRGDMSLVGPRPHALVHNNKYEGLIDGYLGRHKAKPGITGWAQVNGYRGETDTLEKMRLRLQFDLEYIQRWSLLLDAKILLMTVMVLVFGKNAY